MTSGEGDLFFPTLDDLPADRDALDFEPYVATLAGILGAPRTRTPLTLGVFGDWGSGKTSLMRMVRAKLPGHFCKVWFDAWKYDKQETLWRALLLRVLAEVRGAIPAEEKEARTELEDLEVAIYATVDREEAGKVQIDWSQMAAGLGKGAVQVGLSFLPGASVLADLVKGVKEKSAEGAAEGLLAAVRRERTRVHVEQVQFLEQFQERFEGLVKRYVVGRGEGEGRLVVFIDDLDRCLPEKAVEVLEAIKLFLDVPGCAFVLGLDRNVIARGIEMKYREHGVAAGEGRKSYLIDGARYLEKIIQIPFQIPPIETKDLESFVQGLVDDWPDPACPEVFAAGLGGSPRQVKRTVNVFLLLWGLARAREKKLHGVIKPVRLAKVVVIQHAAPDLYEVLKETPRLLRELEDYYREAEAVDNQVRGKDGAVEIAARSEPRQPSPTLAPFVANAAARRVLTLHPREEPDRNFLDLPPDELRLYFTLTRQAEAPAVPGEAPALPFSEPEMVRIPAGGFLMGSRDEQLRGLGTIFEDELPQHTVELGEYAIAKYPMTNVEYQVFVRDTGHPPPGEWEGPSYPEGEGDHPVVAVSWDDAVAYCAWLAEKTGKAYRLPSEAEWEKAARGAGGGVYPWGNGWSPAKANSKERGPGGTTPVGQYSAAGGDSPNGVADMAGNVWEWTRDLLRPYPYGPKDGREAKEARDPRVLRGGSFNSEPKYVRCAVRFWFAPEVRHGDIGFRVMVSSLSSVL